MKLKYRLAGDRRVLSDVFQSLEIVEAHIQKHEKDDDKEEIKRLRNVATFLRDFLEMFSH